MAKKILTKSLYSVLVGIYVFYRDITWNDIFICKYF